MSLSGRGRASKSIDGSQAGGSGMSSSDGGGRASKSFEGSQAGGIGMSLSHGGGGASKSIGGSQAGGSGMSSSDGGGRASKSFEGSQAGGIGMSLSHGGGRASMSIERSQVVGIGKSLSSHGVGRSSQSGKALSSAGGGRLSRDSGRISMFSHTGRLSLHASEELILGGGRLSASGGGGRVLLVEGRQFLDGRGGWISRGCGFSDGDSSFLQARETLAGKSSNGGGRSEVSERFSFVGERGSSETPDDSGVLGDGKTEDFSANSLSLDWRGGPGVETLSCMIGIDCTRTA